MHEHAKGRVQKLLKFEGRVQKFSDVIYEQLLKFLLKLIGKRNKRLNLLQLPCAEKSVLL